MNFQCHFHTAQRRHGRQQELGFVLILAFVGLLVTAHAHDPGLSSATITIQSDGCGAELSFSKADAAILFRSLSNNDTPLNAKETAAGLRKYAADALDLKLDGTSVSAQFIDGGADDSGNVTLSLDYHHATSTNISIRSPWLALLPPGHRQFLSLQKPDGKVLFSRLLNLGTGCTSFTLDNRLCLPAPNPKATFTGFLAMGVTHIWTGYDHLLFLFGLLAVTRRLRAVVKIITCFTVAHSLTLAIAALNLVTLPSRIVEPMIAASIVFVGVENFLRNGEPKGRWLLTFAFGLIHGFGFASALREAGVGEHGGGVALPLVSFNLGVEAGQIAVAAVVLPLIWKLRNQPHLIRRWIPVTSSLVGILGTYWFIQRVI